MGKPFQFALIFIVFITVSAAMALPAQPPPTVVVKTAKLQEISRQLSYPAEVKAQVQATILAETDGVVRKIRVHLGEHVKARRGLMVVQQRDPIFQYAPVAIVTPVTGIVSSLDVTEGALISKGQKLASVINPNDLKVTVEVPAEDLALMQSEHSGTLEIPSLQKPITLTVVGISPNVDPATGTATAELRPSSADMASLRPGMIGKATFKAGVHQGFLVPEDAVVDAEKQTFLRIVKNGKANKVPVTLGDHLRGFAEVLKGLKAGDQVIERASGFVADGAAVKVEKAAN